MLPPLNTQPALSFIAKVKAAEYSQQKEIKLDIQSARLLSLCLAELTAKISEDYDLVLQKILSSQNQDITIKFDGGSL